MIAKLRAVSRLRGHFDARRVRVSGREAVRARYVREYAGRKLLTEQYVFSTSAGMATLALTAPVAAALQLRRTFEASARTLATD